MRNKIIILFSFAFAFFITAESCKKEKVIEKGSTDEQLLMKAKETTGFTWYKNSDQLLSKGPHTGHSEDFLRTRYNATAAAMLDADGKVKAGAVFPDESLIVKELHSNSTTLSTYAVMYKKSGHEDADAHGWVWGYIRPGGEVREPASNKGSACTGCHSQNGNIDLTLMNLDHP